VLLAARLPVCDMVAEEKEEEGEMTGNDSST